MNKFISILRGINVSGHNVIKMEELRKSYNSLGFSNVISYIQSGNLIFESEEEDIRKLESMISEQIQKEYNFKVPVLILPKVEFQQILETNPFISNKDIDPKMLHVTIFSEIPSVDSIATLTGDYGSDQWRLLGRLMYLHCPNGYGNTKLNNSFLENKFKMSATTRNWNSVTKLAEMLNS